MHKTLSLLYHTHRIPCLGLSNADLSPEASSEASPETDQRQTGTEIPGVGGLYLTLHCHHQNDYRIKMDSDESRFNVSLIVRGKVTRRCPQLTNYEEKGEPKREI